MAGFGDLSLVGKVGYLWRRTTVEPMLICYLVAGVSGGLTTQNLNLDKACRVKLGLPEAVCEGLRRREAGLKLEEAAVQRAVATMDVWKSLLHSALPACLILFFGAYSDRSGRRKVFMQLPNVGGLCTSLGLILCTYFFWLPLEVAGVVEALFPALTGGWMTMFMAVFSYIAEVSSLQDRTKRIGMVHFCVGASVSIGSALSGVLFRKIGYYGVFSLSATLHAVCLLYVQLKIKERRTGRGRAESGPCTFLTDFFDTQHVRETMSIAFKSGHNNRRLRVIVLILVTMVVYGPMHGEMTVMYLFTRYRFNWNEVDYSIFHTYSMVTSLIGTAISVGIFSHMLKMDDAIIGVISCMSKILAGFVFAFATTTSMFYIAPLVDIANGTSFIAMRSIASKLVPPDELGKVNSVFGLAEAIVPVIYGPMYSAVYRATLHTVPGAFFLLGGALTAPAVLIFLWMYGQHRQDAARLAKEKEGEKDPTLKNQVNSISEKEQTEKVTKDQFIAYSNEGFEPDVYSIKL